MSKIKVIYLFKLFLLFIIISYCGDKLIYYALNSINNKVFTGQSIGKLNQYLKIKDNLKLIIFGSSRANHNIDPFIIDNKSFNMGVDGRKLAYSATLIHLLPKNTSQTILLHLDPENVFDKDYMAKDIIGLTSRYNQHEIITKNTDRFNQNNIFQKFYWCLNYNGIVMVILKNYFFPKYDHNKYFGYDPIFVSDEQRAIFKNILAQNKAKTNKIKDLNINEIYDTLLDEIKLFCDKNNKTLIVFTSPVLKDNNDYDNIKLKQIMDSKGITYHDFTHFFYSDYSLEYWKDETHLSNIGADKFTNRINDLMNSENHHLGKK